MTQVEQAGQQVSSNSNAPQDQLTQGFSFSDEVLFLADGKPVRAFVATHESMERIMRFLHSFPLAFDAQLTDEDLLNFILSPSNIFLEFENGIVAFERVIPGRSATIHFVFWDRKVTGNEKFLRELISRMFGMLQLMRVDVRVPERNRVMWRMLERVGFRREGRLRKAFRTIGGIHCDLFVYGILKEELITDAS